MAKTAPTSIIAIKLAEAGAIGETVYNGPIDKYEFKSYNVKVRYKRLDSILAKFKRHFSFIKVVKEYGSGKTFTLISIGQPEIVFVYHYDTYSKRAHLYIDHKKMEVDNFLALQPDQQDALLANKTQPDPWVVWKNQKNLSVLGSALLAADPKVAGAAIVKLYNPVIAYVKTLKIYGAWPGNVADLIAALKQLNDPMGLQLAKDIAVIYKKQTLIDLLQMYKKSRSVDNYLYVKQLVLMLHENGFNWPELATIAKSLVASIQAITKQ